jgi:hypothetical protein
LETRNNKQSAALALLAIEAATKWVGLEEPPACIKAAKLEVFMFRPIEIIALLVDFGARFDRNESPKAKAAYFEEFRTRTGLTFSDDYFHTVIHRVFLRGVIGGKVCDPSPLVRRPITLPITPQQETLCEAIANGCEMREAITAAGYAPRSFHAIANWFGRSQRMLKRVEELKRNKTNA